MQTRDLKENAAKRAGFSIETLGLAASLASLMLATPIMPNQRWLFSADTRFNMA